MKKYLLLGVLLLVTGLIGAIYCVETINDNKNGVSKNYNLALRQVAHKLYLLNKDENSQIDPVVENSNLSYSIKINTALRYDTLPYLIDEAIKGFELPTEYTVSINACDTDDISLGYSSISFESRSMACVSREHNMNCAHINIDFKPASQDFTFFWLLIVTCFLLGFFYIIKAIKNNSQIVESNLTVQNELSHSDNNSIVLGLYEFDPQNLSLKIDGDSQTLTFRENKLLAFLSSKINEVITREEILQNVWEDEGVIVGRSLDVFISRLRKLLKKDENISIKSIHGVGYRFIVSG